jgi:hypothetical protein
MIRYLPCALAIMICSTAFTQVKVVHFNAGWNSSNDVAWIDNLEGCKIKKIDIAEDKKAQGKHNISVVPTLIIFDGSVEIKRFEADISFSIKAKQEEIQEVVNELLINKF